MPDMGQTGRLDFPFTGICTFLRSGVAGDLARLDADVAVLGVPFDEGSPYMPGSRFGPRSIREHSLRFVTDPPGYYDPQERRRYLEDEMREGRITDVGDVDVLPTNPAGSFANATKATRAILDRGALPVVIGGDHAITFPVVRAFDETGAEPLHVVHFDAHLDYMPFVHGITMSNQHAFRHIRQMASVASITQIGIRSIRGTEVMLADALRDGNRVVTMEELRDLQVTAVVNALPENARVYVSIDIDALDLPLVPGCVSAEPGGMRYEELRAALFALAEHTDVVGFDLVEVNPMLDVGTGITSYLAAHTMVEFLARICAQPRWKARRRQ